MLTEVAASLAAMTISINDGPATVISSYDLPVVKQSKPNLLMLFAGKRLLYIVIVKLAHKNEK